MKSKLIIQGWAMLSKNRKRWLPGVWSNPRDAVREAQLDREARRFELGYISVREVRVTRKLAKASLNPEEWAAVERRLSRRKRA